MVARRSDTRSTPSPLGGLFAELFEMWRRLVTHLRDVLVPLWMRLFPAETPDAPPRPWLLRRAVVWIGGASVVIGAAVGIALAVPGLPRSLAVWAGVQSLVWAVARWLLMRYAGRGMARNSTALLGASSLGLVVYALAVTPELRALAWVVSAVITRLALVGLGDSRREAARTVGIAWGAQAVVVAASWVARSAVIALLASRG
jgi:hypothetical protein